MTIKKIVSGGQTGADIAGVDAAIECNVPYGGWLPKGRKCEDGAVPETYRGFRELVCGGYPKRTEQNIIDSDGTVIFSYGTLATGSALTARLCRKHSRPCLYVDFNKYDNNTMIIKDWLIEWDIKTLNVAGSRESKHPGIYNKVKTIIRTLLTGE